MSNTMSFSNCPDAIDLALSGLCPKSAASATEHGSAAGNRAYLHWKGLLMRADYFGQRPRARPRYCTLQRPAAARNGFKRSVLCLVFTFLPGMHGFRMSLLQIAK